MQENRTTLVEESAAPQADPLVSIVKAAEYWFGGISHWTVRKWIVEGKIRRTVKLGSRRLIPLSEIKRLIQSE